MEYLHILKNKHSPVFTNDVDSATLDQFRSAMEQPFSVQGALMPDAHLGYSLPIGGVVETDRVIIPAWIGYDIGCGVCALKTTFDVKEIKRNAKDIYQAIMTLVPVGRSVNNHIDINAPHDFLNQDNLTSRGREVFNNKKGLKPVGSLGGGNHFIEVGTDKSNAVWICIHSGSRGFGYGIATEYMKLAAESDKPKEGHYGFNIYTEIGQDYLQDMSYAINYAYANRHEMAIRAMRAITMFCSGEADFGLLINKSHNMAEIISNGRIVHRKGATQAGLNEIGVIPGNMRDGCFIVRGLGNQRSLMSSSHGAGRKMSRSRAKKEIDIKDFEKQMQGIIGTVGDSTLDEAPDAYKDITNVLDYQKDIISVEHHINPIINVKG